jgi:hypothetical protein
MTIQVKDDPLTLRLPAWIDTNYDYKVVYDYIVDAWVVLPF